MMRRTKDSSLKVVRKPLPFLEAFPDEWQRDTAFRDIWNDWDQHRREIKGKLTPESVKRQAKMLTRYNLPTAIAIIDRSIFKGWRGLFEWNGEEKIVPKKKTEKRSVNIGYQFHRCGELEEDEN